MLANERYGLIGIRTAIVDSDFRLISEVTFQDF